MATTSPGLRATSWMFARHFLEMCLAMCIGGTALFVLVFVAGPAVLGYADPRSRFPEASVAVVATLLTAPMALWMRVRGMAWRPILEMSAASMAVAVAVIVMAWGGVLSRAVLLELAGPSLCGPICVAMLVPMLARVDLYTDRGPPRRPLHADGLTLCEGRR